MSDFIKGFLGLFLGVFLLGFSGCSFGEETPPPKQLVENFFGEAMQGNGNQAVEDLFSETRENFTEETIKAVKNELNTYLNGGGFLLGYELYSDEKITEKINRFTYFFYFENYVVVFDFYFYKPKTKWQILALNFDTDFIEFSKRK